MTPAADAASSRDELANLIAGLLSSRLTGAQVLRAATRLAWREDHKPRSKRTDDATVAVLAGELAGMAREDVAAPLEPAQADALRRVFAFLRSGLVYDEAAFDQQEWDQFQAHWPFASPGELAAHAQLVPPAGSHPPYDPAAPPTEISPKRQALLAVALILAILLFLAVFFVLPMLWPKMQIKM